MKDQLRVNINIDKTVLSSKSLFYKTERFIKDTKYQTGIDYILTKLSETILLNLSEVFGGEKIVRSDNDCFSIITEDKMYGFLFKFGWQVCTDLNKDDIVFFGCLNDDARLTQSSYEYLNSSLNIKAIIKKEKRTVKYQDFNKLYLISNVSNVNLPRLSVQQKEIVETIDKNVLVKGVAGSGKTNICIDKIIFTACKNFTGKTLYTTFSRGLLNDTKLKVEAYKKDLQDVLDSYKNKKIVFLDKDHKKALENRLGIYFFSDDDNAIFEKLSRIIYYLTNKVDYLLIEDLYRLKVSNNKRFVDEHYFINVYSKNLSNYNIQKCFARLKHLSKEIIYKEVYGMVLGSCDMSNNANYLSLNDYILSRKDSFSKVECEAIYQIAIDYKKHCELENLIDNNFASRELINAIKSDFEYSLSIIDEVQDYTQVNLNLFKKLSLKLFCVGDALQMINPSYFNFGYLKNLLYNKGVTEVKELIHNYRNTEKIENIIESLAEINKSEFGTHNFVVQGKSIDSGIKTTSVYIKGDEFVNRVAKSNFDNFTFVVASQKDKNNLKMKLKNQEVLTVSEIKGLERSTIVAFNLLTSNADKWKILESKKVNHKQADENSVFRYYYNLFYVGLTRAKQNIFVIENNSISQFEKFFKDNFDIMNDSQAIKVLEDIVKKVEFTQLEVIERIEEFIKLGQYENARFMLAKIKENKKRIDYSRVIDINEEFVGYGKYREAGIKFWEYGLIDNAKQQFILSGDHMLIDLIDSCAKNNSSNLSIDIINYFEDVKDNQFARSFILDIIKKDVNNLKSSFTKIKNEFK